MAFTFFSMFFGAGNLIFPPFVGAQAGAATVPAIIGFIVSACLLYTSDAADE